MTTAVAKPLNRKQRQAARAMASGLTSKEAASLVGVSDRSLRNWRQLPQFGEAVWQHANDILDEHRAGLAKTLRKAREVVDDALAAGDANIAARILTVPHLASFGFGNSPPGTTEHSHTGGAGLVGAGRTLVFDDGADDPALIANNGTGELIEPEAG